MPTFKRFLSSTSNVAAFGVLAATLAPAPQALGQSTSPLFSTTNFSSSDKSRAYAINNVGQTVGYSIAENDHHASHWLNEVFTDLHGTTHLALNQIFTEPYSEAYGISNGGQIVGTARLEIKCGEEKWIISNAFLLAPAVQSDLGTPYPGDALTNFWTFGNPCDAHDSAATAVSNANHVVGWADVDGYGQVHAFLVQPVAGVWFIDQNPRDLVNDIMIDLGTLDNESVVSAAHGVNDDGWVTGYSYVSDENSPIGEASYHAFLVVPSGGRWFVDADLDGINDLMVDLGTLGGNNSWGRDINNSGVIVGESTTADRNTHAFRWEAGVMVDLGTLGGSNSSAAAIADNGDIVGWSETTSGERHAVLWRNGQIFDLNSTRLVTEQIRSTFAEARDVNDDGEIVGWSKNSSDTEVGYLLKPATATQIAAHNAALAADAAADESPTTGGGSTADGRAGGSTSLTPITAQSTPDGSSGGSAAPTNDSSGGPVAGFGLCAAGVGFSSIATLLGLSGMKRAVRRIRR